MYRHILMICQYMIDIYKVYVFSMHLAEMYFNDSTPKAAAATRLTKHELLCRITICQEKSIYILLVY